MAPKLKYKESSESPQPLPLCIINHTQKPGQPYQIIPPQFKSTTTQPRKPPKNSSTTMQFHTKLTSLLAILLLQTWQIQACMYYTAQYYASTGHFVASIMESELGDIEVGFYDEDRPAPDGKYWFTFNNAYGAAFATADRSQLYYTNWKGEQFIFNVIIEDFLIEGTDFGEVYTQRHNC